MLKTLNLPLQFISGNAVLITCCPKYCVVIDFTGMSSAGCVTVMDTLFQYSSNPFFDINDTSITVEELKVHTDTVSSHVATQGSLYTDKKNP
ncbi:hypothetical protein NM688_g2551 [Phlebia brevispora]|uniref:Uncharacterized protein n=1 Tax=Phlebia brevispora TaxID=194682 RepID=A0ACC1T815_9APHY|nr:hypothetical protein NM688_g2551 [Phlebia brevispora]